MRIAYSADKIPTVTTGNVKYWKSFLRQLESKEDNIKSTLPHFYVSTNMSVLKHYRVVFTSVKNFEEFCTNLATVIHNVEKLTKAY